MTQHDCHSHIKSIQTTFGYRYTCDFPYLVPVYWLIKIALHDSFQTSTDLIGGQIWTLGVNFRVEFEFLTENDQKRQFKAVLCDLLIFHFFQKLKSWILIQNNSLKNEKLSKMYSKVTILSHYVL